MVLYVPPLVLLLPPDASEVVGAAITGVVYPEIVRDVQWDWALGRRRLFQGEPDEHPDADRIFEAKSLPVIVRGELPSQLLKDAPEGVDPVEFAREQFHRAMKRQYVRVADTLRAEALARFDEDVLQCPVLSRIGRQQAFGRRSATATPDCTELRKRGFKTKRDANEFYASAAVAMKRGEYIEPQSGRLLISELGEGWLARKRHLKPSSYRVLESTRRNYDEPKWGKRQIVSILRTKVQAWVTNLATGEEPGYARRSATVIIRAHEILRGILADAVGDKRMSANPAEDISLPRKGQKPKVYLSREQVRELADAAKYPTLARVLANCGLRWGEMAALCVLVVDHARKRLKVALNAVEVAGSIVVGTPNTHRGRKVSCPRFMADELKTACAEKSLEDLLFPGPNGDHLRNARVHADNRSWFASAVKASGTPRISPHDLRHPAAGFAVRAGANVV